MTLKRSEELSSILFLRETLAKSTPIGCLNPCLTLLIPVFCTQWHRIFGGTEYRINLVSHQFTRRSPAGSNYQPLYFGRCKIWWSQEHHPASTHPRITNDDLIICGQDPYFTDGLGLSFDIKISFVDPLVVEILRVLVGSAYVININ